jgi:hypothetical protein
MHQGGKVSHSGYELPNIICALPIRMIPNKTSGNNPRIAHVTSGCIFQVQPLGRICLGFANLISRLQQQLNTLLGTCKQPLEKVSSAFTGNIDHG